MEIVNFIFVYGLAGFMIGTGLLLLAKKNLDTILAYILGYGIAPLLISLMLYYLYRFFPQKPWFFYTGIICSFWLVLLVICIYYQPKVDFKKVWESLKIFFWNINKLSITVKVLSIFIIFTVVFVFIRGQVYPNLWADAIYYFQQGHVYSVDRSLDRLVTQIPFSEDGSGYVMNPSIRPALPILYSFFFTNPARQNIFIFSGSFLYFYYFILTLSIFSYILKKFNFGYDRILLGLTFLLSSYYLCNFLIYGFKEIILIFYLLTALIISYTATKKTAGFTLLWPILLGVLIGLSVYINVSGVIIGGIIGIIYLVELFSSRMAYRRVLLSIVTVGIFLVLFSAAELKNDLGFISKVQLSFQQSSDIGKTEANEYGVYKINEPTIVSSDVTTAALAPVDAVSPDDTSVEVAPVDAVSSDVTTAELVPVDAAGLTDIDTQLSKQILIKGKLQGFTQIQFYGIIFIFFIIIIVIKIGRRYQLTRFEKSILGFFWLFFFIVMDPFFLKQHPQAYVLSISPKYTILLIPLAALFITMNYNMILNKFAQINIKYLLWLAPFGLLILPGIRNLVIPKIWHSFEELMPIYNDNTYYMNKFDALLLGIGIITVITTMVICYLVIVKKENRKPVAVTNLLFISSGFIFPFIFLLNSNYNIVSTFQNILAPNGVKLETTETNEETLAFLKTINYLNNETDQQTKILFLYSGPHIYYIENYHRFAFTGLNNQIDPATKKIADVQDASYIVLRQTDLALYDFNATVEMGRDFGTTAILKILR